MIQFFDTKRFGLLVLKHWADHKRKYALSALALLGMLITWFLFTMFVADSELIAEMQETTFFFGLFAVGTFYASLYYSDLDSKAKGSHFLMVPAASFEKFLCSWLFTAIAFPLLFIAAFYLVDILMVKLANTISANGAAWGKASVVNVFEVSLAKLNTNQSVNLVLFFFSIQSLFLLGSVYFRKYSFFKTIITGFVIVLILFWSAYLAHKLFPDMEDNLMRQNENWLPYVVQVVAYAIAPLSWMATYFVLKTKKV